MSDLSFFQEKLQERRGTYQRARLRLVLVKRNAMYEMAQGTLVFETGRRRAVKELDYGNVVLTHESTTPSMALEALDEIISTGKSTKLTRRNELVFDRTMRQYDPDRHDWPIRFGKSTRRTSWPELQFYMKSQNYIQVPGLPLLKGDYPPLLTHEQLRKFWLDGTGIPFGDAGLLEVVLPDYRAGFEHIRLSQGELSIRVKTRILPRNRLRADIAFVANEHAQSIRLKPSRTGFQARLAEVPEALYVFLRDRKTDDVVDWAIVRPFSPEATPGMEIETPPSVVEDALDSGETDTIEFKAGIAKGRPADVLESVSAFANTRGGRILFGVADDRHVVGVVEFERMQERITNWVSNNLDPPATVHFSRTTFQGKILLVLTVPESENKPHRVTETGRFYVRHQSHDVPASRAELDEIYRPKADRLQGMVGRFRPGLG